MKTYALFWIAGGFDAANPSKTDFCSRQALLRASQRSQQLREAKETVRFGIPRSMVRDRSGQYILFRVLFREAVEFGHIYERTIFVTDTETTGSPTDGLAIAEFARDHPDTVIEIFTVSPQMGAYLRVMYTAVARWIVKYDLGMRMSVETVDVGSSFFHKLVYRTMRVVVIIAAQHESTFRMWYFFLNRVYQKRIHGFQQA